MFSKRDIIIFFAGAEAFHTLSHVIISVSGTLPLHFLFIVWDQRLNMYGIIINAIITILLLWWASRLKK